MKKWNLQNYGERVISDINITPLTDVMLVLLLIFMVTTPLIVMESFKIKLPKALSSGIEPGEGITVSIRRDGSIYIDTEPIEPGDFFDIIKTRISAAPDEVIIIKADKDALHGAVVKVLDTAKKAGARRLSIATQPEARRNATP
ncbi:MAG: biopolymer transporter ExbD [Thermodesulfobacteriota bacterium]